MNWRGLDRVEEKKNKVVSSSVSCGGCPASPTELASGATPGSLQCSGGDTGWSGGCAKLSASSALEQPRAITSAGLQ